MQLESTAAALSAGTAGLVSADLLAAVLTGPGSATWSGF